MSNTDSDAETEVDFKANLYDDMSDTDAYTGKFVRGWWLDENDSVKGLKISSFAFCPTSPNVLMASCNTKGNAIRVLDMRAPLRTVLSFGNNLVNEYPAEMKPAWNPDNGQVVAPFNKNHSRLKYNHLVVFDTRFIGWGNQSSTVLTPFTMGTHSISFGNEQGTDSPIMVTASDNGSIGISKYESYLNEDIEYPSHADGEGSGTVAEEGG
ncbi:hypothetical protein IW150_002119 [Coemansia sp. RSA 2607]|nr:hypothetical protein IW150_002119 [Coemansia sp. RSA 2607]